MREVERRNVEQRRQAAREEEDMKIQEELRKIRARQAINISASTRAPPDVELGDVAPRTEN